ncbi:MAG: hypothetical protein E1N59_1597 [Puniceicoccaceae bacterium 5H]|nr:MAG: hypothetical protein E1N59_1597 [Puniceicoccaceae bacterium 5H]
MAQVFPEARWRWTPLVAVGGALLLAALLFCCLLLTQEFSPVDQETVTFREVVVSAAPPRSTPPPPESTPPQPKPPPPEMTPEAPNVDLQPLDVSLNAGAGDAIAMGVAPPSLDTQMDAVSQIEKVFTFEDLPDAPRLLNAPPYRFPSSLQRQGVHQGRVMVRIKILPDGSAELLNVVSISHAALEPVVRQIIARARFTPPKVDGQAQTVVGNFPLVLGD